MNFSNKKSIDIIIDKQQEPKINLAIKTSFKYRPNTVNILNKKPNAANMIVQRSSVIRPLKLMNCFSIHGECDFHKHVHHEVL
jgi:ribosomal protein L23